MVKVILSTSVIFLVIVAVRKCFRGRAGNVFLYSLWLLFAAGLVVPVFSLALQEITQRERGKVESPVSIMNLVKVASSHSDTSDMPVQPNLSARQKEVSTGDGKEWQRQSEDAGKGTSEKTEIKNIADGKADKESAGDNKFFSWINSLQLKHILYFFWTAGTIIILLRQLWAERLFRGQLIENREEISYQGQKVYVAKGINTPLLFRGRGLSSDIYLPEMIMGNETLVNHAILHENVHRKHGDIWWGYVRNLLVALYWFYPLVWIAAVLSKRDCEYACDSSVMKKMDKNERISYGNSLLSLIQVGKDRDLFCTATAMKIGKSEMEVRIRMIKRGRKRNIFVTVFIFLLLCIAGTVAFTDAMEPEEEPVKEQKLSSGQEQKQEEQKQPEKTPSEKEGTERENALSAKEAEFEITDLWGVDMPYICYEDDKRMIFTGYFGLFVYSRETGEITQSLNLKEIGCNMTQGDNYCEINVSEDGKTVYLHVLKDKKMYQYSVDTKELQYVDYKLPDKLFNQMKFEKKHKSEIQSTRGGTIGDLVYWHVDGRKMTYEPLFYKPYGSCDYFKPKDIKDLSEASFYINGKEYVVTDKKKLLQIEKYLSDSAEKIEGRPACPFYCVMYLKRTDGVCGKIFPATDSCSTYQAGNSFYDFKEKTNEAFWKLFGITDVGTMT